MTDTITRRDWLVALFAQTQRQWDDAHGDGFNEEYLRIMPSLWHLMAHNLCQALGMNEAEQLRRRPR